MEETELSGKNEKGKRYWGMDWRHATSPLPIKPHDSLRFCDLRSCILDRLDLSNVEFIGCRLNGTAFQGANLQGAQFIGCFSSDIGPSTDFRNCIWRDTVLINSDLNSIFDSDIPDLQWPVEVADIATNTLSEDSSIRYKAAHSSEALGNPVVALILACLLADKQWEVRDAALEALSSLHQSKFPHEVQTLMQWMFLCLGDEHPIVRQTARSLVESLSPSDEILLFSVNRMKADSVEEQLAGLRAAIELCRVDDLNRVGKNYSRLIDRKVLQNLLTSPIPEVRSECLHLLGMLDDASTTSWLLKGLSDSVASVRIAALLAIKLLNKPPAADTIIPLLRDPDEKVRIEVLFTLGQVGDFDTKKVEEVVLSDPSLEVQELAFKLLKGS